MAELLIDGIGAISGVLGTIGFFSAAYPKEATPEGSIIRIKVGLSKDDEEDQFKSMHDLNHFKI